MRTHLEGRKEGRKEGRNNALAAAWRSAAVAGLLLTPLTAQVPESHPARVVHPGIAPPVAGLVPQAAPLLAVDDGVWNHGEGFGANYADHGGWHDATDGTNVTSADVHVTTGDVWVPFTWHSDALDLFPGSPSPMLRMEGYLRPSAAPGLPDTHPRYGFLGPGQSYVDQGAFEMFKPTTAWDGLKKILVVIHCKETIGFPRDSAERQLEWRQIYRGYFSPDGLVRNEPVGGYASAQDFLNADANDGLEVERPILNTIANWNIGDPYWPIEAYPVLTVMHRNTTLNEQRYLQLTQAVKVLLTENDARNPVGAANRLTEQQVTDLVVVVFIGGSNGGLNSSFATLRYPHLVHGCFSEVINPSYQRLYAEFDLDRALAQLTGIGMGPAGVVEDDFLVWNQYVWAQHIEMHDISYSRLFLTGSTYRPACFAVGDEDTTSTGVNWVRIMDGAIWRPSGVVNSTSSFGSQAWHTFGWTAGESARHQTNVGPGNNPYTGQTTYYSRTAATDFWQHAINQRQAELQQQGPPIPVPALTHLLRNNDQQLFGLDDPQEWWLGRIGDTLPADVPPLTLDTGFVAAVNPGATGNLPGAKEAMFIRDSRVFVGSADGFVSSFHVDTTDPKQPLVRDAQSPRLGHECFAIAPVVTGSSWWLVAGTRRHLHRLDSSTLQPLSGSAPVELPWEVAQPHHLQVGNVLPGLASPQIVFAAVHGGLCFYDLNLEPIYEWPEPGIVDFFLDGANLTILSSRGVVATVTFAQNTQSGPPYIATMHAVSKAIPQQLLQHGATADPPCQGRPADLERMRVTWGGAGIGKATISLWRGDEDKNSLRGHWLPDLLARPYLPGFDTAIVDVATCSATPADSFVGDHALILLGNGRLQLYDQGGGMVGEKTLTFSTQGFYQFGAQAHHLAVGELVGGNPGSFTSFTEEVVIVTNTGLLWMHIGEVAGPGTALPAVGDAQGAYVSGFWVEKNGPTPSPLPAALPNTQIQARTNQTMQSTWAMGRRPGSGGVDSELHVLDARGVYWKVGHGGEVQLWDLAPVTESRGWDYVGPIGEGPAPQMPDNLTVFQFGSIAGVTTIPYCPKKSADVVLESAQGLPFITDNWQQRPLDLGHFDGFFVYNQGGALVQKQTAREVWHWTFAGAAKVNGVDMEQWGNLLQGKQIQPNGTIDGIWASTQEPDATTRCPYFRLRSHSNEVISSSQQALAAVELQQNQYSHQTAVVLGCPGGRIRVLLPGMMRMDDDVIHDPGTDPSSTTEDLGFGVSALAVRHVAGLQGQEECLKIWFGTIAHPDQRPAGYSNPSQFLTGQEVSAGAIHVVTWTPGGQPQPFSAVSTVATMHPTAGKPRGASAVVGMLLTDLIPLSLGPAYDGEELIVGTLSGDVIVYNADSMQELWRTHVHGAAGCYNAIRAEDLNGDGHKELYIAGSSGLWRFIMPGELQ